jgi:hypothetical protein
MRQMSVNTHVRPNHSIRFCAVCICRLNIEVFIKVIYFITYIHTYLPLTLTHVIPKRVAEAPQIFLRDAHVLSNLLTYEEIASVTGGKPIAMWSQFISDISSSETPTFYQKNLAQRANYLLINKFVTNFNIVYQLTMTTTNDYVIYYGLCQSHTFYTFLKLSFLSCYYV